jgi:hypothetical protein
MTSAQNSPMAAGMRLKPLKIAGLSIGGRTGFGATLIFEKKRRVL